MENGTPQPVRSYGPHLKKVRNFLLWMYYFSRFAMRQFFRQRGLQIASSLTYTTLLALVPLVTVMFGFLGSLPMFEGMAVRIQTFIFTNFVPSFGITVQEYLQEFSDKASNLTLSGILALVVIALMLLATIENALNLIWRVRTRRSPAARILVYWTILTLGPLLMGISILSISYLLSLQFLAGADGTGELRGLVLRWVPFLTSALAFTLLYVLIPNCFVLRRHALAGGITAAVLFECARSGFGLYVKQVPQYEIIYGTLAIIPVFLIWIYISWVIVLLGAHVSFCLSAFRLERAISARDEAEWTFHDVCRVVRILWDAQKQGAPLPIMKFRRLGIRLPDYHLREILEILKGAAWVTSQSGGRWILIRDMAQMTLMDLYQVVPNRMPLDRTLSREEEEEALAELLQRYNDNLVECLSVPLGTALK